MDQCAFAAAITLDVKSLQIIEHSISTTRVTTPYMPGLLMLRESRAALSAIDGLREDFDLLMVDANGRLHPRKFGLACFLGVALDKPTIGIAKGLLCGQVEGVYVKLEGEKLAHIIEKRKGKRIFVSIGNKISLKTATSLAESMIKDHEWLPEPLRLADRFSRQAASTNQNSNKK